MPARNAELEALCDPPCPLDEMRLGRGRTDLPGGLLEQGNPAIEMAASTGSGRCLAIGLPW